MDEEFICDICGRKFKRYCDLERHMDNSFSESYMRYVRVACGNIDIPGGPKARIEIWKNGQEVVVCRDYRGRIVGLWK